MKKRVNNIAPPESFDLSEALEYSKNLLQRVSRTFSFTIAELPPTLETVITNAYLLCRAADTIEDDPGLNKQQKYSYGEALVSMVSGKLEPAFFADEIAPLISSEMLAAERELMRQLPLIVHITRTFTAVQQYAIERCVRIMWQGMSQFIDRPNERGIDTYHNMDKYAYYVASVVGEMLTEIFCSYSSAIAKNRAAMLTLAISFGKGLQFSNFLQDQWEDRKVKRCWLPIDVFEAHGVDLKTLRVGYPTDSFVAAQDEIISITHAHLTKALEYTLLIDTHEPGIRRFCFWLVYLAALTLGNIYRRPVYHSVDQIRPSKFQVISLIAATKIVAGNDRMLIRLFKYATRGLPFKEAEFNWRWEEDV